VTTYTLVRAGHRGAGPGVQPVVVGGEGDKDATGGQQVATLQPRFWRERALAVVDGTEWVYGRETGDLGGRLRVDPEHTARLRAVRTSFWTGRHEVDLEGTVLHVKAGPRAHVWEAGDEVVGRSGRIGFWSPVLTLELRADVPLPHAVFLLWLEHVFTRRNQAAAASA
jgi:hypothetical protein